MPELVGEGKCRCLLNLLQTNRKNNGMISVWILLATRNCKQSEKEYDGGPNSHLCSCIDFVSLSLLAKLIRKSSQACSEDSSHSRFLDDCQDPQASLIPVTETDRYVLGESVSSSHCSDWNKFP